MKLKTFSKFILVLLIITLIIPVFGSAGSKEIGKQCESGDECVTGECDDSSIDLPNPKDNFCVCNTAKHCEDKYGKQTGETWVCKSSIDASLQLDYCESNLRGTEYPVNITEVSGASAKGAIAKVSPLQVPPKIISTLSTLINF